jgi:hypothetical protein
VLCHWKCCSLSWLVLLQFSPVVTIRNYYTITHLHSLQSLHANTPFYLFGPSGIHLENFETETVKSQSHIATDGPSVSKSWCRAPSGAYDQMFITVWKLRSCFCGAHSLTRGRVCLLYMLLGLPVQSFSGLSPMLLATIFSCLRFETSRFVASYSSQDHGGGILPPLHTRTDCEFVTAVI